MGYPDIISKWHLYSFMVLLNNILIAIWNNYLYIILLIGNILIEIFEGIIAMPSSQDDNDQTNSYIILANGTLVSHYRILEKIGAGGMGEVYLAEDIKLNRKVALKFLPQHLCQSENCRMRFRREAQAVAKLNHPNIVTIYEVSEYRNRPFFAMEHIEGDSLRDIIKSQKINLKYIIELIIQICEGLQEAHEAGIIHRDIKPSNIILTQKGRPKLADFGLVAVEGGRHLTKSGSTLGTIGYMSPEQAQGQQVDQRSDLFSVGVVLYELITGRRAFAGEDEAAILHAITHDIPEPLARYKSNVPNELQRIIDKILDKNMDARYQHVDELRADLIRLMSEKETISPRKRRRLRLYFPAAAVLILAFLLWWTNWLGLSDSELAEKHLVVLPFASLGDDLTTQVLCDGLLETLASKLTQMIQFQGSLCVVPASEVREREVVSARQARRVFGVTHVVTGSVQQRDNEIRMTLNLVDAKSERQISSAVIDERITNFSVIQDSIVAELAMMLEIQLRPHERHILTAGGTKSPSAYYSYLQASGYLQRYESGGSVDTAIVLFGDAIERDPDYALAYAGLGKAYWYKYNLNMDVQWIDPAIKYSQLALELSDEMAPVLVTLGLIHRGTGRYEEAVEYIKQALTIDSIDPNAYSELATAYEALGELDQAESTYLRAIELKPDIWGGHYDLALFYFYRGRNQNALGQLRQAEMLAPNAVLPCNDLGGLYLYLGYIEEARILLKRSLELEPNYSAYSNLGVISMMEKRFSEAARMYEYALELDDHDYRVWINLASVYETLPNQRDKAIITFRRAIQMAEKQRLINPNDPWLLCHLADCYNALGEHDQSLTLVEEAITLSPNNVEIMARAGLVYEELGNRDKALELICKAVNYGYPVADIKNLEELDNLRADPRFDSLISNGGD